MNNQAAQTMPQLPRATSHLNGMGHYPLYSTDQMHQYARDYAAALSQTAGVESLDGRVCGYTPGQSKVEIALDVGALPEWLELGWPVRVVNPSAPSASGGEDDEAPEPTAMQIRYAEGYSDGVRDTERIAKERESPAAAVSERARAILADAWLSDTRDAKTADNIRTGPLTHTERIAVAAIEQALTQQRGAVAWSVLQIGNRGAAYDPSCARRAYTYQHQPGNLEAHRLGVALVAAADATYGDNIDRGLSLLKALEYVGFGVFQIGLTTPQPGAEALRDEPGNDPRVDDDSFTAAVRACRSQLGALRPNDDEPEEQWMWDKLTKLESLLGRGGKA